MSERSTATVPAAERSSWRWITLAVLWLLAAAVVPADPALAELRSYTQKSLLPDPQEWAARAKQEPWDTADPEKSAVKHYRVTLGISGARNVAAFTYVDAGGQRLTVVAASVPNTMQPPSARVATYITYRHTAGGGLEPVGAPEVIGPEIDWNGKAYLTSGKHSEFLLVYRLEVVDRVPDDQVKVVLSELEPCDRSPAYCRAWVQRYKQAEMRFNHRYSGTRAEKDKSVAALAADAGGYVRQVQAQQAAETGGVDFTTLQLRYMAAPRAGQSARYALAVTPGGGPSPPHAGARAMTQASDALAVWLALPASSFWVNLNPNEPDRIIDERFGRTDAGRVLLEADLQLKKTVAHWTHPDSPEGGRFWASLRADEQGSSCLTFRQWIVPGTAAVHEDDEGLHIIDAPMLVKMESELAGGAATAEGRGCDPASEVARHNEAVFRDVVMVKVQEAVNTAPEYADLRRVYLSRVAAEWYQQRAVRLGGPASAGTPVVPEASWSPREVFDRYVRSYQDHEYDVTRTTRDGQFIHETRWVFGGVDLTQRLAFDRRPGGGDAGRAAGAEAAATRRPTAGAGGTVWLGISDDTASEAAGVLGDEGGYDESEVSAGPAPAGPLMPVLLGSACLLAPLLAVAVLVVVLARRAGRSRPAPPPPPV